MEETLTTLVIARRFAEHNLVSDACRAYALVAQDDTYAPEERMEAAVYIFESGDNYRISYVCFIDLYQKGYFREDILQILNEAFYLPNEKDLKNRYRANCRALKKYPYLFRSDFPEFDALPVRFYPFDDGQYYPFARDTDSFDALTVPGEEIIRHWFFRELEKPILAKDVFSQYELEYLNDNVRPSEWVGRENHIYLHYSDWGVFCSWLQVLDFKSLIKDRKLVFLIEDEISQYPIDFKERFGIDYGQYPLRPVGIREVNRLIWHVQFSSHNGGDFFNEIFDAHPNILTLSSIFLTDFQKYIDAIHEGLALSDSPDMAQTVFKSWDNPQLVDELYHLKNPTDKDALVAFHLRLRWSADVSSTFCDPASRIVPAIFFQPHFPYINNLIAGNEQGYAVLKSDCEEAISAFRAIHEFKYIKSFVPIRRFTTSYGGTVRFAVGILRKKESRLESIAEGHDVAGDILIQRVLNRSFLRNPDDRLMRDSKLVRFEDGKTNPRATFTALANFLDLPYTDSMTYCSENGIKDPGKSFGDNNYAAGFSLTSVYRTYDDYANDSERRFIEYLLRDIYRYLEYDFHYYDGSDIDEAQIQRWIDHFDYADRYIREMQKLIWTSITTDHDSRELTPEENADIEQRLDAYIATLDNVRRESAKVLSKAICFINSNGEPLRVIPKLELDTSLLETKLYH